MKREKIAIDIDDVLSANAEGFVRFSNERWGTNLSVDDYNEHWAELWQTDLAETERRAIELHHSGLVGRLPHYPEAEVELRKLCKRFDLVIVTSRRAVVEKETYAWLEQHFAGVFSDVYFAGFWDNTDKDRHLRTKAELCQQIGVDYLIDDQLKHCMGAAEVGINAILFGSYSWNMADSLPTGVVRCNNWHEVTKYFERSL